MSVKHNNRMDICMDKMSMQKIFPFKPSEHGHVDGHFVHADDEVMLITPRLGGRLGNQRGNLKKYEYILHIIPF